MTDKIRDYLKAGRFRYPALSAVAAVFLVAGLLMASSFKLTGNSQATTVLAGAAGIGSPSFADLAQELGPAVVNIKVTKIEKTGLPDMSPFSEGPFGDMFRDFFGNMPNTPRTYRSQGAGSGVIISPDGKILTNNHVVDGAREIVVTLDDKREYKAQVIGRDSKTDLAVLKIEAKDSLKPAVLGDSDGLRVGEWVLAIGNPFGLSNTVTSGIVSAKGRVIGAGPYDDFIQTDAPINPGNSGGPLIGMRGEVVGINTAIIPNGQGIGFAIPVNTAKMLLPQLVATGKVTRGYLGINIQDITEELAATLNLKGTKGALVSDVVEGSPAEKGGIKRGDVVVAFNHKEIKDSHELSATVAATPIEKEVSVQVVRDGKEAELSVKVGRLPSDDVVAAMGEETQKDKWGLQLQEMSPAVARQLGLKNHRGVVVTGVRPGSPADAASILKGDVLLEVNRQQVRSVEEVKERIEKSETKGSLLLLVRRGNGNLYVVMKG
jgi:serine protease Do